MDLLDKLSILADAAKYDVSCSSSGSSRKNTPGGIGNGARTGICHSWSDDGRCISLLKILFTNYCIYNCTYCINRAGNERPRAAFTPRELADLTINFYRRNYIEGLFLSSAVLRNPDYTMEQLLKTVRILRKEYKFNGYIHLKAIPGADLSLIFEAGKYADRMSVNIELPTRQSLKMLAPEKDFTAILTPMKNIGQAIRQNQEEKKKYRKAGPFVPAGQSTQLIVGASPETDYQVLKVSENLYGQFNMRRIYYSAYVPVNKDSILPALKSPPLLREHRLYQADWLLRFYKFRADELLSEEKPDFDLELDPKANWALRHLEYFPVEINKADYELLLRVPGIGVKSARRIVTARRNGSLSYYDLEKFGTVLKRARYFITCQGKYYGGIPIREDLVKSRLLSAGDRQQLSLFSQE
ncbi:MAG TPA: putative DNA modification/repair radical SAM protein [Halanaerobiaceae bacterium]|jgi:putative DNA modification/repair radical SAM protein|nr:putative DNA modification/repair radical SAM protein [Bacillota bacterium]HHU93322.1 putative DNA modification/repair radical SAM protein [Halanaerobiaceae bacterium]HOA40948.1 putative DNA modification/repair radical SAM protein [Halanaerobiales bacterium]HPZ62767.1 putative DNA modification/repair radical SAM protein [Halanaerobiales bacterium]HQD04325.1 putative DNA modification/repair radical SAM protein [Halanaerobiales bacterium]